MANLKYKVPASCPATFLRGVTLEGGKPTKINQGGKLVDVVEFRNPDGKPIYVMLEGKPELQAAVAAYEAATAREAAEAQARFEANVPGFAELEKLSLRMRADEEHRVVAFNRMMADEFNDGAAPPPSDSKSSAEKLAALKARFPRAALYLRAKNQAESGSWADNTGARAAGRKAMAILKAGGSLEEAEVALAERHACTD